MKVLALVILFAAAVFGQNPYEYVDDALLQRVGQIIYEYDQKVAASRAAGGSTSNSFMGHQDVAEVSSRNVGYQPQQHSQRMTRGYSNQDYSRTNVGSQQSYNNYRQMPAYQNRMQRQFNPVQPRVYQQQQQHQPAYQSYSNQRQQATPYNYQAPQVQARKYQEPVTQKPKSGLSGYILSEPVPVERVAEFHFTDGPSQGQQGGVGGGVGPDPVRNDNRFNAHLNGNSNNNYNGFRLA